MNYSRFQAFLLALVLAFSCISAAAAETLQDCHRVVSSYSDTKQANASVVRLWHVETALPAVTDEINALAEGYASSFAPSLPKAANAGKKNSRLDVEIRYSRTGLHWLSFLIQARTVYHQKLTSQSFTTRTYDMSTGERLMLTDIIDAADENWAWLSAKVREALTAYWPDTEPDAAALDALCSRSSLENADFTMHGMSMVLHFPAGMLYPEKNTLMEVPLYYPDLRPMLTESACYETDNLSYYRTCALTFDDGPSSANTPKVLDALMETGAVATFFVIGNRVDDYRWLVQREHDNGHAVASHNWHHGNVLKSSGTALRAMPAKVNKVMIKAIGIPVRYDRVPGGRYPRMIKIKAGWSYIQWSLDTYDWRNGPTSGVVQKVKDQIHDGDIILCHDIKKNTPESTRQIVRWLEEQGYLLLTVDELFVKDGVILEPNKVYYRCDHGDTSIKNN